MYLDPNVFLLISVPFVLAFPKALEACLFWFGRKTMIRGVVRPDPNCDICGGAGAFLHHGHCVLPCWRGCGDPKPQKVLHWQVRQYIEKFGRHMGLDQKKALQFSRDFEDLANSYLGPPIPCFVKTEHGWEYRHDGNKKAVSA